MVRGQREWWEPLRDAPGRRDRLALADARTRLRKRRDESRSARRTVMVRGSPSDTNRLLRVPPSSRIQYANVYSSADDHGRCELRIRGIAVRSKSFEYGDGDGFAPTRNGRVGRRSAPGAAAHCQLERLGIGRGATPARRSGRNRVEDHPGACDELPLNLDVAERRSSVWSWWFPSSNRFGEPADVLGRSCRAPPKGSRSRKNVLRLEAGMRSGELAQNRDGSAVLGLSVGPSSSWNDRRVVEGEDDRALADRHVDPAVGKVGGAHRRVPLLPEMLKLRPELGRCLVVRADPVGADLVVHQHRDHAELVRREAADGALRSRRFATAPPGFGSGPLRAGQALRGRTSQLERGPLRRRLEPPPYRSRRDPRG